MFTFLKFVYVCFCVSFCVPHVGRCPRSQRTSDPLGCRWFWVLGTKPLFSERFLIDESPPQPFSQLFFTAHTECPIQQGPEGPLWKEPELQMKSPEGNHSATGQNTMLKRDLRIRMVELVNFTSLWAEYTREQFKKRKNESWLTVSEIPVHDLHDTMYLDRTSRQEEHVGQKRAVHRSQLKTREMGLGI